MRCFSLLFIVPLTACQAIQPEDSPLAGFVRNGDVPAVRRILSRGADPNAPAGLNDWPPLLHAVHKAQLGTAVALLDGGADVNRPSADGTTALMMAAGYGYGDFVKLLLARGADPSMRDRHGETALDFAITGVADIDRFTLFACQNETAALFANRGLQPRSASLRWARLKRCSST